MIAARRAGGMFAAVRKGLVQRMIGESAALFQDRIDSGEQTLDSVNKYVAEEEADVETLPCPAANVM